MQFRVLVNNPLPAGVTFVTNQVAIADDGSGGSDITPTDNTKTITTPVAAAPDLQVFKTDYSNVAYAGTNITYTIFYTNAGTQDATGVVLTEDLAVCTSFRAAAGRRLAATPSPRTSEPGRWSVGRGANRCLCSQQHPGRRAVLHQHGAHR